MIYNIIIISNQGMEKEQQIYPTTFCETCKKHVLNYELHQIRCRYDTKVDITKTIQCQKCSRNIDANVYPLHELRCAGKFNESFYQQIPIKPRVSLIKKSEASGLKNQMIKQEEIRCPNCGARIQLIDLDSHEKVCESGLKKCEFCSNEFPSICLEDHYEVCDSKKYVEEIQKEENQEEAQKQQQHQEYQPIQPQYRIPEDQEDEEEQELHNYRNRLGYVPLHHLLRYQLPPNSHLEGIRSFQSMMEQMMSRISNLHHQQDQESRGMNQAQIRKLKVINYGRTEQKPDICTICICDFQAGERIIRLGCKHLYHTACITRWLQSSSLCPVCKTDARKN